jgi:hypothetical protein
MPIRFPLVFSTLLLALAGEATLHAQPRPAVDNGLLALPVAGERTLRVLSPSLLEVTVITVKEPDSTLKKIQSALTGGPAAPEKALKTLEVSVGDQRLKVAATGWKRRTAYAPIARRDLRVATQLYLQLATPLDLTGAVQTVTVRDPSGALGEGSAKTPLTATTDPRRLSPAIHVNQEGYVPDFPKKAMVGYYLGDLGEMPVAAAAGFALVETKSGNEFFHGELVSRPDVGQNISPLPYQSVLMADFSAFKKPGEYQLVVPGLGASYPFLIDEGIAMGFARTYALGLYQQRCGCSNDLPFTRFIHAACHLAPAQVPSPQSDSQFSFTWSKIEGYAAQPSPDNPLQLAPKLTSESAQLYPFVKKGTVEVSGGHHDAGDYSKYTINSTELIHYLVFAADSVPGLAQLDNLGIAESGDGIPDVIQEAKWEADFLAKLQDSDGGFYFLVYPKTREYETGALPEHGDAQVVWPKNTSVTAAAVAALAQCASSPAFRKHYPAAAATYLKQAQLGWKFLQAAIAKYGKDGAYQKITFYSDHYAHNDELVWAACELYLATGDTAYQEQMLKWFPNPADPASFRWGWWRMSESWGNAIRSYAFAARSGRLPKEKLDVRYLDICEGQVVAAAEDALNWSRRNAYATPFPLPTKKTRGGGWYFSLDQASDLAVAWLIDPKPAYLDALVGAMNYEGGTNPVNVTYLTGLGLKRQREVVSQYAQNDRRTLPPTGIPIGNIQAGYSHSAVYGVELRDLTYPNDAADSSAYAIYDRWSDAFNVTTEFITVNQARGFLASIVLATRTAALGKPWKAKPAKIIGALGSPMRVEVEGEDLAQARIVWEGRDQEPAFGESYRVTGGTNGDTWVEAEVAWPDGRRAFASTTVKSTNPEFTWFDDAPPTGAYPVAKDGEWEWSAAGPAPQSGKLAHRFQKSGGGSSEHWFTGATAKLEVESGDTLFSWVYLDPANPPKEIMLMWHASGWEHRAYWGANLITYGENGSAGRYRMGDLPPAGKWVKLIVPAKLVGLEKLPADGMGFAHVDGQATWDAAGKTSAKK